MIKPVSVVSVSELDDYELVVYLDKVKENQHLSDTHKAVYTVALKEAVKRELVPNISTFEASQRD